MSGNESVRLEDLLPHEVAERWALSPIAYIPIGCIEYHGPHLPLGVDGFTAHAVCEKAARHSGGVVHPVSFMANGCLDLPYTITFPADVIEQWARAIIRELHRRGAELVVLLTGHGPLDLIHLLKRVCREFDEPGHRAYGLCYLELNAANLESPELGEPTVIDHASTVETSWIMACRPELVELERLPVDPEAQTLGVYGRNPRFTASAELGIRQQEHCAGLLARRARAMLASDWSDTGEDLNTFVEFVWPEPLEVGTEVRDDICLAVIRNPGRASRYISSIASVRVNGTPVDLTDATVVNRSAGEVGAPYAVAALSAENGIYVRRGQSIEVVASGLAGLSTSDDIRITVELAGVKMQELVSATTVNHE